jgi:4a-hydroxytetrahydrobiopterin dehydratase
VQPKNPADHLQPVLRDPSTPLRWLGMRVAKTPARFGVAKRFSGVTRCPVMADLIKQGELKERMKKIPEWELEKKHIERTFEFDDFADAIDFVNAVAEVAEEEEHHPDIDIRYNKVRLVLSTHSKGGLTELDFGLAERIDTLAE